MRTFLAIARTGLTALLLHPLRSLVTTIALLAVLLPYLVGLGIAQGLQDEAAATTQAGADLYVQGEQFGRTVPVPLDAVAGIKKVPGVTSVIPRIVGRIELGRERVGAVVVGVPLEHFPAELECVDGRLWTRGNRHELVIGSELARRLNLQVGSLLPPFYHSKRGNMVSEVVGIFRSDVSLWQARLIVTSFETAAHIFDQSKLATDLLVACHPGFEEPVRLAIQRRGVLAKASGGVPLRVVTRSEVGLLLPSSFYHREGVFTLLFVVAFAVAILVILVTSGFGLGDRRREIGILKATGWQTDQILLRSLVESALITLTGASLAVVLAFVWLRGLNGWGIAGIFLTDVETMPAFQVPFRLTPVPALLAFVISLVVVLSGSLYSTWRAAVVPPRTALR